MAKRYPQETKNLCKEFFVKGWSIALISEQTNVDPRTLYNWKDKEKWDESIAGDSVEIALSKKIVFLSELDTPTEAQQNQLDRLCKTFATLKIDLLTAHAIQTGTIPTATPTPIYGDVKDDPAHKKPRKKREKKTKNDISGITREQLDQVREELFFDYQKEWYDRKNDPLTRRNRFILKSRQIGATFYFAFEALDDAIRHGENQIFLSASRDQAEVFKAYIIAFALQYFEVELKGQGIITLSNGAELRFLSTNSRTAQSYHGHLYVDECFWIPHFAKMWKVASGMAAHKKWRRTLFSTPSAISHEAYPMWAGEMFNRSKADKDKVEFDITHKTLKNGALGVDKWWRHMVTVKDAEAQGCELFDIEELQTEYSKDDFLNLFMCQFIDDAKSIFNLGTMMTCYATKDYDDYNPKAARPFVNKPVAIGYDPSRSRDNASLCILAIPLKPTQKWRVLATLDYHGQNFQYQANRIKDICDTHNVQHIGIDVTGMGLGVFELVEVFYRRVTPILYSHESKTRLVMKAIDVIENGRFEYQSGDKVITQAFMMISKTTTPSGIITYAANRNSEAGHADVAWSIMHALAYESIAVKPKTTVVFSD